MKTKKEFKELDRVRNKYGDVLFRMAVTNALDKGFERVHDADLTEIRKQLEEYDKKKRAEYEERGKKYIPIMTVDFQFLIWEVSKEIEDKTNPLVLLDYWKEKVDTQDSLCGDSYKEILLGLIPRFTESSKYSMKTDMLKISEIFDEGDEFALFEELLDELGLVHYLYDMI